MERFQRTIQLVGEEKFQKLQKTKVVVLGVGGVGSLAVEALVRSGVGSIVLVDKDVYDETNINRQWPSNVSSIGRDKVAVVAEECLRISPSINVGFERLQLSICNLEKFFSQFKNEEVFVIEAIDDLKVKVAILHYLKIHNIQFVTSMGAANVTDIDSIRYGELNKTTHCPVAKIVRKELGLLGVKSGVPVVYSFQERQPGMINKGSIMPITASFGLRLANWVIQKL